VKCTNDGRLNMMMQNMKSLSLKVASLSLHRRKRHCLRRRDLGEAARDRRVRQWELPARQAIGDHLIHESAEYEQVLMAIVD
jgi:hypothetical protein